jgi:hypothetical protein
LNTPQEKRLFCWTAPRKDKKKMTEEANVEERVTEGAGGETNPPVSEEASKSVAVDADALSKLVRGVVEESLKPIKGEISGIYSRQDKDRNSFREFMEEVKKQEASGLSENDAIDAAESALSARAESAAEKKMLKEIHSKLFGDSPVSPAGNGENGAGQIAQVISELPLDGNSPDVMAILAEEGLTLEQQELKLRRLADRPKKQPSPSAAPSGNSGTAAAGVDEEALLSELQTLYKEPSKHMKRILEIQKALGK